MVTHALINAKNGKLAVTMAITAATIASQAINTYMAKRQGQAVADGMKPNFESQQEELRTLRTHLDSANQQLESAKTAIMDQQARIDRRNFVMSIFWYALGVATPIALKVFGGIG